MSDVDGTVVAIQGRDVDSAAPDDTDVLTWDDGESKWKPAPPPKPLEPWEGTPNTQAQVIKRVPFVLSITGSATASTNVSYNLPSGKALSMEVHWALRDTTSFSSANAGVAIGAIANVSSTMSTPNDFNGYVGVLTGASGHSVTFSFDVSGSVVTLQGSVSGAMGHVYDIEGFVDLMVI